MSTTQLSGIGYTETILRLKLSKNKEEQGDLCVKKEKNDEKISHNKFNIIDGIDVIINIFIL